MPEEDQISCKKKKYDRMSEKSKTFKKNAPKRQEE
jgi:hypothetical protein